jgi:DNA-binding MarR family transcriptional regulator
MRGDNMSRGFPKSALLVLRILRKNGPMAPKDISKNAELPLRTVSFALRKLLRWEVCRKIPNLADMRRPLYHVDPEKAREIFMIYGRYPR